MTKQYQVKGPDGVLHIISGPDDATPDQIVAAAAQLIPQPAAPAADEPGAIASLGAGLGEGFGKTVLGAQSLAGKGIRALGGVLPGHSDTSLTTLVTGQKTPGNFIERAGDWLVNDAAQGREKIAGENKPFADAHPLMNSTGQVGGEIVATLPVGGVIGKAIGAGAKALPAAARVLDPLATAASSGGLKTGISTATLAGKAADVGARMAGGAMTGGAGTLMVDPDHAAAGAIMGAAVPPVLKGAAALASKAAPYVLPPIKAAATSIANTVRSPATQGAHELMTALDLTPGQLGDVLDKLRNAPELVPGSRPTVSQALQMPQASVLERVVGASPGGTRVLDAKGIQSDARNAALNGVAPVDPSGYAEARDNLGRAVTKEVIPAERDASKRVSRQYEEIDPNDEARVSLPTGGMESAANTFVGPGTVGQGSVARSMVSEAGKLSNDDLRASWRETQRLRSSLGDAIEVAKAKGHKQEAAALTEQLKAIDATVTRLGNGNLYEGEAWAPEMGDAWADANAAHAAKMDRFHTGPQASIFRSTNPAQGGEVGQLFWGNRPGIADDVDSFRKLIGDNPALLGQFRSMVTTDAADKATQGDILGQKFVDWTENMLPGLKRAFDSHEVQTLQNIAADVKRAGAAAKLGRDGGSDTYQKAANALDNGFWDTAAVKMLMDHIPGVSLVGAPIRASLAESAGKAKARRLADLLVDPRAAAAALSGAQPGPARAAVQGGLSSLTGGVSNALSSNPAAQRGALSALDMALQPGQQ
jgi:hypothetical protein